MNTDPTAQPSAPPVTAPRRRRWLRRLAQGAVIMLVVLLCAHLIWYATASADLAQARAVSAAAGLTDDAAKVIPPPCADADNAALPYQRAFGLLTLGGKPYVPGQDAGALDPRLDELLSRTFYAGVKDRETFMASEGAAALTMLDHEDFRRAWTLVAEGARLPRCRFDNDYSAGAALRMPHLTMLREFCQLGSLRARLLAAHGRVPEAADQFADLLWLLRQYREEPLLISQLVDVSAEALVLEQLRLALEQPAFAAATFDRVQLALRDGQRAGGWNKVLQGEFALFGCWGFRHIGSSEFVAGLEHDVPIVWLYRSWLGAPLLANDEAAYRRLFADLYAGRRAPDAETPRSVWHPMTSMLMPALAMVHGSLNVAIERADAALLALHAAGGGTPVATPALSVERGADGGWIISHLPKPGRSDSDQKKLQPWRIPARR